MSRPDSRLELSGAAQADFSDILSWTLQTWGERQTGTYRDVIDAALKAIAADPGGGRRHAVFPFRFVKAGRHLIFYRVVASRIFVVRILHTQMDIGRHLGEL